MIITIVCIALYSFGWLMGFVTCSLASAVNEESKKLQAQKDKVDALRPPNP